MRELSVVGPAPTPSFVCTHCPSGSCDQHGAQGGGNTAQLTRSGAAWGQLLQVIQGEGLQVHSVIQRVCKERQVTVRHSTAHMSTAVSMLIVRNSSREGIARNYNRSKRSLKIKSLM